MLFVIRRIPACAMTFNCGHCGSLMEQMTSSQPSKMKRVRVDYPQGVSRDF